MISGGNHSQKKRGKVLLAGERRPTGEVDGQHSMEAGFITEVERWMLFGDCNVFKKV